MAMLLLCCRRAGWSGRHLCQLASVPSPGQRQHRNQQLLPLLSLQGRHHPIRPTRVAAVHVVGVVVAAWQLWHLRRMGRQYHPGSA